MRPRNSTERKEFHLTGKPTRILLLSMYLNLFMLKHEGRDKEEAGWNLSSFKGAWTQASNNPAAASR